MKPRIRMLVLGCAVLLLSALAPVTAQAAEGDGILDEIRSAMAERDLASAKTKLAEAAKMRDGEAFTKQRERLQLLYEYLEEFWKSVDEGGRSLQAVDELVIGDVRTAVVEYQPGLLVLRVKGENRRYTVKTLPAKVALTLAERVLKPDAPQNKVFLGTFLLTDGSFGPMRSTARPPSFLRRSSAATWFSSRQVTDGAAPCCGRFPATTETFPPKPCIR